MCLRLVAKKIMTSELAAVKRNKATCLIQKYDNYLFCFYLSVKKKSLSSCLQTWSN